MPRIASALVLAYALVAGVPPLMASAELALLGPGRAAPRVAPLLLERDPTSDLPAAPGAVAVPTLTEAEATTSLSPPAAEAASGQPADGLIGLPSTVFSPPAAPELLPPPLAGPPPALASSPSAAPVAHPSPAPAATDASVGPDPSEADPAEASEPGSTAAVASVAEAFWTVSAVTYLDNGIGARLAELTLLRLASRGLPGEVLLSARHLRLRPGYLVVSSGRFQGVGEALDHLDLVRQAGFADAYVNRVVP